MTPFVCQLVANPEVTGIAITEQMLTLPDEKAPQGFKVVAQIGVLWDNNRAPSPSYHSPNELAWLSVPTIADPDEEDEDADEEDEDEIEEDADEEELDAAAPSNA
jgi:hypothetical protein